MLKFLEIHNISYAKLCTRLETLAPNSESVRFCHSGSNPGFDFLTPPQRVSQKRVGIFWDLDNKPPKSYPPYQAAGKLKAAAGSFGVVRYMVAYANHHAFSYVPPAIREERKERKVLNQLENRRVIKPAQPYLCRVCGRKFHSNDRLVNHFKEIHESEQIKRLNQLESARGKRRVELVARFAMKMEKYKNAARDILTPKVGYGLADELKWAGFWVQAVPNKPQSADIALKNHMVDMMDHRRVDCLVLVSDDSDFVGVLKEARLRCLKTVVVGDDNDGALKRSADVGYSWKELMLGKIKKEAVSVVGKWKDRDVLKRLEWTYNPETEKKEFEFEGGDGDDFGSEDGDDADIFYRDGDNDMKESDGGAPWWKLDSDGEVASSKSRVVITCD